MEHPAEPRHRNAQAISRRTNASASASIRGAVGIIVMLMLAWGAIVASGLC
jgi:hypothetical protein